VAERHVLDSQQLMKAFSGAVAVNCGVQEPAFPGFADRTAIISVDEVSGAKYVIDPRDFETLAAKLATETASNLSTDPEFFVELLANVALATSRIGLNIVKGASSDQRVRAVARNILTDFAINSVIIVARSLRHYIPRSQLSSAELSPVLQEQDRPLLINLLRRSLGLGPLGQVSEESSWQPVARAFVATPLTHLDDTSHDSVMSLAADIRRLLNRVGMVAICPDRNLRPSTTTANQPDELSRAEQLLIAGSDLLVAVGVEYESWGVSRSVSWAEAECTIAVLTSMSPSFVSRVLNNTPNRVYRVDHEEDKRRLVERLEGLIRRIIPLVEEHAQDRISICTRTYGLLAEALKRLDGLDRAVYEASGLTHERVTQMLYHPVMMNSASFAEGRVLRNLLGEHMDPLLDMLLGRQTYGNQAEQTSRLDRRLSLKSFANLESVAQIDGWTDAEIRQLISFHLDPAIPHKHLHYSTTVSGSEWRAIYRRLFGTSKLT
jgi:hypothetical protein